MPAKVPYGPIDSLDQHGTEVLGDWLGWDATAIAAARRSGALGPLRP